ncbi:MAG: glycosyltransferase family 4 protein [Candidatus Schekmanbacteria bacterium]|nr:glycosyltransferase family 4 protein [Candidatus Schekmanbacteria bacterium]
MQEIHVAVLGTRGFPGVQGGVERHCQELFPRLAKLGVKAEVFARESYVDPTIKEYQGVELITLPIIRKKSLETILHTLWGLLIIVQNKKKYDLVHMHDIGPSLLTPLARLLGLKVVMTYHSQDYERPKWSSLGKCILRTGEWCGARFSNQIIAVSGYLKNYMQEHYNREAVYIPNGVTIPERLPAGVTLKKFNLKAGEYILGVGRLVKEKGFHDLIAAFKGLSGDWKLVIVGAADHEDDYSLSLKASAQADGHIVMTGFQTGKALQEIYANAGLFVIPSYHEGLPITLLEAFSYGLRVLASDIPPHLELIKDWEIIFPMGDVKALRDKLAKMTASGVWQTVMMQNIKLVQENFDWDKVTQATFAVYQKTVMKAKA